MSDASGHYLQSPINEALIRAFTHDRFVELFLSQSRRAQLGLLAAAAINALIWFGRSNASWAAAWMVAVAAVTAWRLAYTTRLVKRASIRRRETACIALLLLVNGLLMAVPLTQFDHFTEPERAATSIILIGAATASVATTSGYRFTFLYFAAPMLLPLSLAWATANSPANTQGGTWGLSVLIVLFLMFLASIARQAHQIFEDSSRYRFGEQILNAELQKALELADESNRAKTQFLAAASHDLRQPIHSMNVLVAALSLRTLDAGSREIVGLLDSVNQTLSKQLDSLLDISKLDAGTVKPNISAHRLDLLVIAHGDALSAVAAERGLRIQVDACDQVSALTDDGLFMRLLSNLTDNALKFTPRGGTVTLRVEHLNSQAVVTVEDTGIGIPPDHHERIFREFYQVANVERDRSRGLGLGLSIVRRLAALLGVSLRLRSMQGHGTTMTLSLAGAAPQVKTTHGARPMAVLRGLAVLVVDDESVVRESMRLLLSELGCSVHLAEGTRKAIKLARGHRVDVVLSDFRLRGNDSGLVTIKAIRRIHPASVGVLITGDTAPGRLRDAEDAGVPLLHKPVTLNQLLTALAPVTA